MHILQGTWSPTHLDGEFLIWGEYSPISPENPSLTTDKIDEIQQSSPDAAVPFHPRACSWTQLQSDISYFEITPQDSRIITVSWPIGKNGYHYSPKFISGLHRSLDQGDDKEGALQPTCSFMPVSFPALVLDPLNALCLLTILPKDTITSENFPPGSIVDDLSFDDSLLYWVEATKLVIELLTRGSFLPGLMRHVHLSDEIQPHIHSSLSAWHLLFEETKDQQRLQTLGSCMPSICHALTQPRSANSHITAQEILESFLSRSADVLIRSFLDPSPFQQLLNRPLPSLKFETIFQWLKSLTKPHGSFTTSPSELIKLEEQLFSWSGKLLSPLKNHPLRICFTLRSPLEFSLYDDDTFQSDETSLSTRRDTPSSAELDSSRWLLEFSLQSRTEPEKKLSARELWEGSPGFLLHSEHSLSDLEEILLENLGKSSAIFSPINRALLGPSPSYVLLSVNEAYTFLRQTTAIFEKHDFGVILPLWWVSSLISPGLKLNITSPSTLHGDSLLGYQRLLEYRWEIALGEERFDIEELKKLAAQEIPLVQRHGRWIELSPKKIKSTLEFLESQKAISKIGLIEALQLGSGVLGWGRQSESDLLPVTSFTTSGWLKQLLESSTYPLPKVPQPQSFHGTLRPYQEEGLSWLFFLGQLGIGGCLADDMGLGKTIQFLALLLHEKEFQRQAHAAEPLRPTLLIVPMSILGNWHGEAKKFAPSLNVHLHHGPQRLMGETFTCQVNQCDLLITTYHLTHRDEALLANIPWGRIALDEAQNIKNLATRQTQAIRRLNQLQMSHLELRTTVPRSCLRLALTGTPLENHLEELWSIFDFLNPGYLGTLSQFRATFSVPIERYKDREAEKKLSNLVKPFLLRRLKTDPKVIDELPEKIEMTELIFLSREQAALYQSVLDGMLPQVEESQGIQRKGLVLATITKLKQICNHPELYLKQNNFSKPQNLPAVDSLRERSGKLNRLEELLETLLAEGDKTLIFTQYAQMGYLLQHYLRERFQKEVLFLHGTLVRKAREELVKWFQQDNGPQIFVLSLKVGGLGLNLTQANQVIHYDQWWNPAVEEQATDRAYRIGQKRNVQVRKLLCKGTLEEKIASLLEQKRYLARSIVSSTTNAITQLDTDELRQLLQLGDEGIFENEEE